MRRRAHDDEPRVDEDELGDEVESYLRGDYLGWCLAAGMPVSGWAWLNRVAHADHRAIARHLEELGVPDEPCCYPHAALLIEAMVVTTTAPEDLLALQLDLLVPLELELMSQVVSPRAAVDRVSRTLY